MVRGVALVLMVALAVPANGFAQAAALWESVPGLPPGTRLKLALVNGSDVTGTLVESTLDTIVMRDTRPRRAGVRRSNVDGSPSEDVAYNRAEIASVSVLKMAKRLHTCDRPNGPAARNVVRALGIGKKIELTTTAGRLKANILAVGDDGFVVSQRPSPLRIEYRDVRDIEPTRMSSSNKVLLVAAAGLGVFVGVVAVCYNTDCSAGAR